MRKLLIPILMIVGLIAGCAGEPEPIGSFRNAEVVGVEEDDNNGTTYDRYYVTIEKHGQKFRFKVYREIFETIKVGAVINGDYYDSGYMKNITFPNLEKDIIDKSKK